MPQVSQVLCCYNCKMFQVHFIKKSNKWQCKVCNEKQSLKKAFKIGSAPECRSLVQQLNMQKGCQQLNTNYEEWEETNCDAINERLEHDLDEKDFTDKEDYTDKFVTHKKSRVEIQSEEFKINRNVHNNVPEFCCENSVFEKDCLTENIRIAESTKSMSVKDENLNNGNVFGENSVFEKDYLTENIKIAEITKSMPERGDMENLKNGNGEQCEIATSENISNCNGSKKRHSDTNIEFPSAVAAVPPYKKNRGFQIIKNAALKLS